MALFGRKKSDEEGPARARTATGEAGGATPVSPTVGADARQETKTHTDASRGGGPRSGGTRADGGTPSKGGDVATIGKSIIFKGELTGSEDLEIDGSVEGDIKLPDHTLTIGPNGKVKAHVTAKCVQVIGHITGDVNATERVEIQASGVVEGDIRAPKLLVQEGAVVNGAIEMTGRSTAKPAAPSATGAGPASGQPGSQGERKAG